MFCHVTLIFIGIITSPRCGATDILLQKEFIMKTTGLILIVVALHCAVIGSVFFISGCGTTAKTKAPPAMPIMPPPQAPQSRMQAPAVTPAKAAVVKPTSARDAKLVGGGEYIVQAGDSLSVIAKRCHVSQAELVAVNKLADPNKIRIGQKLILPAHGRMPPVVVPPQAVHNPPAQVTKVKVVETIETVEMVETIETVPGAMNEYLVKSGDNLSKIAARYRVKVSAIRKANKLQSDKIRIGQKLIIPETAQVVTSESVVLSPAGTEVASSMPAASVFSSGIIHVVQPNEDMSSIAKLYAVTIEEISELNELSTNRTVQVGQRLKIP